MQIDDFFTVRALTGCVGSPDGERVLYGVRAWDVEQAQRDTAWWVVPAGGGEPTPIVEPGFDFRSPSWAGDSASVYALHRADDGVRRVWRIGVDGGEPQQVTDNARDIGDYRVVGDAQAGEQVYYTIEQTRGGVATTSVYRYDVGSGRASGVCEFAGVVKLFSVSPTGRYVAAVLAADDRLITNEGGSRLVVYDREAGAELAVTPEGWRDAHPSPYGWFEGLCWSSDGGSLAFVVDFDALPPLMYQAEFDAGQPELSRIDRPEAWHPEGWTLRWRPGTRDLMLLVQERGYQRVYRMNALRGGRSESIDVLTPGGVVIDGFSPLGPDACAIVKCTTTQPENLYRLDASGEQARLTDLNPHIDTWKLPSIALVEWAGADGRAVQGVLELPPGYEPGAEGSGPLAMVVVLHGGPSSANLEHLRVRRGQGLLAARGYAVLCPNFRGSTGYGDGFMKELVGRPNDVEVKDVLAGVQAMVDRGIADPERLGVMGWSYGGYLTNCLISRGGPFKAASTGAGIVDMHLQWGLMDTPGWAVNLVGGDQPWENIEAYRKASPLDQMDRATAATLIHVGGEDPRCPPANARVLHRALTHFGNVEAELLIYPGEGHGLRKYEHQRMKMQWEHAWFDRHLRGMDVELPSKDGLGE
jgi:dipeptidyl aminopeptidase/acylaminoacyl peptidase